MLTLQTFTLDCNGGTLLVKSHDIFHNILHDILEFSQKLYKVFMGL